MYSVQPSARHGRQSPVQEQKCDSMEFDFIPQVYSLQAAVDTACLNLNPTSPRPFRVHTAGKVFCLVVVAGATVATSPEPPLQGGGAQSVVPEVRLTRGLHERLGSRAERSRKAFRPRSAETSRDQPPCARQQKPGILAIVALWEYERDAARPAQSILYTSTAEQSARRNFYTGAMDNGSTGAGRFCRTGLWHLFVGRVGLEKVITRFDSRVWCLQACKSLYANSVEWLL
ncbi:hypothetical protein EGW08_001605 [Elysia chlorotica]|uniref:Uncharacterized protein n=1 Tax=Elysia chlorotica TaxID=188477 RepID=A0A433U9X7_ELYCH|nr:hypothetical protein EGW08_001605 [Elysia chlorotica]